MRFENSPKTSQERKASGYRYLNPKCRFPNVARSKSSMLNVFIVNGSDRSTAIFYCAAVRLGLRNRNFFTSHQFLDCLPNLLNLAHSAENKVFLSNIDF